MADFLLIMDNGEGMCACVKDVINDRIQYMGGQHDKDLTVKPKRTLRPSSDMFFLMMNRIE